MKSLTIHEECAAYTPGAQSPQKDRIEALINGLDYPILAEDFEDIDGLMYLLEMDGKDLQLSGAYMYIICWSLAVDGRIIAYLEPYQIGFNFISCEWWQHACNIMPELVNWQADFTYLTATNCQPCPSVPARTLE